MLYEKLSAWKKIASATMKIIAHIYIFSWDVANYFDEGKMIYVQATVVLFMFWRKIV